ncbi:hypothetical protein HN859_04790 [Candidatus Parcubacteria bacterium]|jgi:prepilin signal peptidase PulO-like enzyme (type II secretory pathway)|nr:hypothetical protein [Candidatus Parcubacteria bacterium]
MNQRCYCPVSLNITIGLFLIFLAIVAFLHTWGVFLPLWLSLLSLLLGLLSIVLNSLNRVHERGEDISLEQADKLHANEGF